jgi:selenocysteine-specific elongation factor
MKEIILGTAGHIDHGKTTLIKAITGIDTDRLKEEKERGITIELGFAHMQLPSGQTIGIIDVPGHEKFVKNMVAGATGIDLVALIIAADEGVMPQTREHLEICQLLKIGQGIVVLTKIDMVDEEWLELVREDVREYLSSTFLVGAPIVEVSAVSGEGIEALIQVIDRLTQEIPGRDLGHIFRLPVDRVFSMKGFGTVVTGTAVSGAIETGDDVTVYPQGFSARIRGIQVYNQEVGIVRAGLRTAINLQSVEKAQVQRGNVVATKGTLKSTYMVDVLLELLPSAPRPLKNRAKARFHAGTAEIIATVVLLDRNELNPGESCFSQIRLESETTVLGGDRFVLRSYSPVQAIGGGEILHPYPLKKKRFSDRVLSELAVLRKGDRREVVEQFVSIARFDGLTADDLSFLCNVNRKKLDDVLKALLAQKRIVRYDKDRGLFIHASFLNKAREEMLSTLGKYHRDFPLKAGLLKEELRSRTMGSKSQKLFNYAIAVLDQEGTVVQEKDVIRLASHQVHLAKDQEKIKEDIERIYREGGLQPPYFKEVRGRIGDDRADEILPILLKDGILVKAKEDLFFHQQAVEDLKKRLISFLRKEGEIDTAQLKSMTNSSRKYTIPLIEYFDRTQITVRVGDRRVLRKK